MKKSWFGVLVLTVLALGVAGILTVSGQGSEKSFKAILSGGFQEVPAISSTGTGEFRATVDQADTSLSYELQYSGLEGTSALFAHVQWIGGISRLSGLETESEFLHRF